MTPILHSEHILDPQLSPVSTGVDEVKATVGLLSSEILSAPLLLSLSHIEELIDDNVSVLIQRGLGNEQNISDYHFTEFGADIMEDIYPIIALSNIVLKYEPLSLEETALLKNKQIIFSTAPSEYFSKEMVQFLHEKKITAIGLNLMNIDNSQIQNTVYRLVSSMIFSGNIKSVIQLNPLLLKSVYCYNGDICNKIIAENAGVPWKNIVDLCWNWN